MLLTSTLGRLARQGASVGTRSLGSSKILYLTDVEGDLSYWHRFLQTNKNVFSKDQHGLRMEEDWTFVFGGDVCDRGNGDLRILQDFVSLRERHPNRVFFILGNRDVNKLRIPFNLHHRIVKEDASCYWIRDHVHREGMSASQRLQWLLESTMGAPHAFSSRKQELIQMRCSLNSIDDAASDSYIQWLFPTQDRLSTTWDSLLLKYLQHGRIALRLGDNLFLHGAIHNNNMGWVPPANGQPVPRATSLDDWIDQINEFASKQMESFDSQAKNYLTKLHDTADQATALDWLWDTSGGYGHHQPGSSLLQYGMGTLADHSPNPSVIYSSYLRNGCPRVPDKRVADWLLNSGVRRLVVGHQPHGDCPWIFSVPSSKPNSKLQVVCADNSYAGSTLFNGHNIDSLAKADSLDDSIFEKINESQGESTWQPAPQLEVSDKQPHHRSSRGVMAMTTVTFTDVQQSKSNCFISGSLSNGLNYWTNCTTSSVVGRQIIGGWYVKSDHVTVPGCASSWCLLSKSEPGYNFKNWIVPAKVLPRLLLEQA